MNAEQKRLAENNKDERWHLWGPYLAEPRLGNGARGLQRQRRCLELFPARSRPIARLSLGRGWHRRNLRFQATALPGFRILERAGAILKERFFGVTGPQGSHGEDVKESLLLHGQYSHAYLHADALPLSTGSVSLRGAGGGQQRPFQEPARKWNYGTSASFATSATSILFSNMPRSMRTTSSSA